MTNSQLQLYFSKVNLLIYFKKLQFMHINSLLLAALLLSSPLQSELPSFHQGRILFLIQHGEHEKALKLYQSAYQETKQHDFDLLHQMGLRILQDGYEQNDPECQLLSLFGAAVSAHEDAYYILEGGLKSNFPEIQLIALEALARYQTDRADLALMRALGVETLQVRYEAAHQLCKKKHPHAVNQAESLLYKTPKEFWPIYPPLFAMVGDSHSTRVLRKLLTDSSKDVRLIVILSVAKYQREDLLPQVRQQATHHQYPIQEACAQTLGLLKDEQAIPLLEKLTQSRYPSVALAAQTALYRLGKKEYLKEIEKSAQNENLFAIALLGTLSDKPGPLIELMNSPHLQIRCNAIISLLQQNNPKAIKAIDEILLRDKRDLAFSSMSSPGKTFKAWKATPSANQLLKDDLASYQEHIELKEALLKKVRLLSATHFITLADQIFNRQQNDLVPTTVELLEELNTKEAISCLKEHHQQLGAPLVRHYCNLALYRLNEPGPYGELLRQWVTTQSKTEFILLKPFSPWEIGENSYSLRPEENSKLLIQVFEAFASHQDSLGIEALIEAIATGHPKNKYALAGLLLRATQ